MMMTMMRRGLRSVCAKFGRSERSYCVSRRENSSSSVTFSTLPSGGSLFVTSFFGYTWYLLKANSDHERLWDVLSEKKNQTRILSRQHKSKLKKVEDAETKLIESVAARV